MNRVERTMEASLSKEMFVLVPAAAMMVVSALSVPIA